MSPGSPLASSTSASSVSHTTEHIARRSFLRENSLSIAFGLIFLAAVGAQAIVGHRVYNQDELAHHGQTISLGRYLTSSDFGQTVMENWQSEYLQFTLYVLFTIWFVQRGSAEGKAPGKEGLESDEEQKVGRHAQQDSPKWARVDGLRRKLFENSLLVVMVAIWLGSWFAQSVTGWSSYNATQIEHHQSTVNWLGYIGSSSFWEDTLQNWQSEFLAVGSFAILSVYLRQRGSPESKPVGLSHAANRE
jgi:hypothetical protein